jgi:hypothetical protein
MVERLQAQKGIEITYKNINGANHFYNDHMEELDKTVNDYLDECLVVPESPAAEPAPSPEEEPYQDE